MAAHALIFDLDGTVWDSAPWFASGLANDDPSMIEELTKELITGGNIVALLKQAGISRTQMLRRAQERNGPPRLFSGMAETITALKARGTPLGVATSLPGSIAIPMLRLLSLESAFDAVVHAGICRVAKPNPTSIIMALNMLGQRPSPKVCYVGDRASDAEAAERAGVRPVWLQHGYEKPKSGSDVTLLSAPDLLFL